MDYVYSGFLKSLLSAPDAEIRDSLDHLEFSASDLQQWKLTDREDEKEWRMAPARLEKHEETVVLEGSFEDVRPIDNLADDDPRYWVPLSPRGLGDGRFPIDLARHPVIEITYRCLSPKTYPACVLEHAGGSYLARLKPSREWRTLCRKVCHFDFPSQIENLTLRVYSTARAKARVEFKAVRFRTLSAAEEEALAKQAKLFQEKRPPKSYPLLDEFLPFGVYMKAGSAKRLAETMEISFSDYFRLAFEDIARHHHNAVALEEMDQVSTGEWQKLLDIASARGIRILAMHEWPLDEFDAKAGGLIATHISPYSESKAVLGWSIVHTPQEHHMKTLLKARGLIEQADPNHPLVALMRESSAYALYAPFFAASGAAHLKSRAPWTLGTVVGNHAPLCGGRQFWTTAATYTDATDTPEWNTCPEMRLMLNQAFGHGARGWFAASYQNDPVWVGGHCQRTLTGPFLTFSDLWSELGNRVERFSAMAPVILNSALTETPEVELNISWRPHARSKLSPEIPAIEWNAFQGPDYELVYVINNDTDEVTPVNIEVPSNLPKGVEVYDITDFVRSRAWAPMERQRHIEMFPGQGQIIFIAPAKVCDHWRGIMIEAIEADDRRQLGMDMDIAHGYNLDLCEVQRLLDDAERGDPLHNLLKTRQARDLLIDTLYGSPHYAQARSEIIQASAGICGCDGTLCRLLGMGKVEQARELGLKVLPLTRQMAQLRLQLRQGHGKDIQEQCSELSAKTLKLMAEIRAIG